MTHLSLPELDALLSRRLGARAAVRSLVHLAGCRECRVQFRRMRSDEKFLKRFREGIAVMDKANHDACAIARSRSFNQKIRRDPQ